MNAALPSGSHVGAYTIDSLIAAGEYGFVYLALDSVLLSKVALKEYFPQALCTRAESGEVRARLSAAAADLAAIEAGRHAFVEEARLLARLNQPGLVRVLSAFEANQTAYRVMPYHDGSTLAEQRSSWIETPDDEWLRNLLLNVLEPLEALHAANVVHGHVHPGQVILLEGERPVLLGFGTVPRALHQPMDHAYAPVEQSAIGSQLSRGSWTDIYSLAATAWFAAVGRAPVASVDRSVGAAFDVAAPLNEALGMAPGREAQRAQLTDALSRALETLPSARPQTDAEFRAALGVEVVPLARRPPAMAPLPPPQAPPPEPEPAARPAARPASTIAGTTAPAARHAPLRFEPVPPRAADPAPAAAPVGKTPAAPQPAAAAKAAARNKPTPEENAESEAAVRAAIFAMVDSIPDREPGKAAAPKPERARAAMPGLAAKGGGGASAPAEWDMETRPAPRSGSGAGRVLAWGAALLLSLICAVAAWQWSRSVSQGPGVSGVDSYGSGANPAAGGVAPPPAGGRVSTDEALADAEALLSRPPALQDPSASAPVSAASAVAAKPAAGRASAPARTAPLESPAPAQASTDAGRSQTPQEVCAGRSNFALHYCMQITCAKGQYSAHQQCREFRAAEAVY